LDFRNWGIVGFAILWQISDSRNITMIDNTMSYHSRIPTKYNRRDQLLHGVCEERFPGLFPGSSMKRSVKVMQMGPIEVVSTAHISEMLRQPDQCDAQ